MLLFWLMTIIQLLVSVKVDGRRFKRIIFGRITLDRGSFSAINYYVWIRNLHHCGYVYGHGFYVHRWVKQPVITHITMKFHLSRSVLSNREVTTKLKLEYFSNQDKDSSSES